jgi:hypothetical protein
MNLKGILLTRRMRGAPNGDRARGRISSTLAGANLTRAMRYCPTVILGLLTALPVTAAQKDAHKVVTGVVEVGQTLSAQSITDEQERCTRAKVNTDPAAACAMLGHSDIAPGVPVVVRNEENTVIATAKLGTPTVGDQAKGFCVCRYPFTVTLPPAKFYTTTVGNRDGVTRSREYLEKSGWVMQYSLGP